MFVLDTRGYRTATSILGVYQMTKLQEWLLHNQRPTSPCTFKIIAPFLVIFIPNRSIIYLQRASFFPKILLSVIVNKAIDHKESISDQKAPPVPFLEKKLALRQFAVNHYQDEHD